jgi:hypothetical protein
LGNTAFSANQDTANTEGAHNVFDQPLNELFKAHNNPAGVMQLLMARLCLPAGNS